jgi:hypothetical protein
MARRRAMIPSKSARFKRNHRRYRTSRHFKHKRTGLETFWYDWPAKSDKPAGGKRSQRICQNRAGEAFETGSDRGVLPAQKRALSSYFFAKFFAGVDSVSTFRRAKNFLRFAAPACHKKSAS